MDTKKLVYSALFIALGLIIPQIFHFIGGPALGGVFLPMHFPVLAAGLFAGPLVGFITGVASPLLSSILTGMPPVPRLWFMILELGAYGILAGLLYQKYQINKYFSLLVAMIGGRFVYGISLTLMVKLVGVDLPAGFGVAVSLAKGIPGIILQIIIIPILITILERSTFKNGRPGKG